MNAIPYLITAASIVGTVANSFQKRWCFYVWMATNAFWVVFNITGRSYAQALLYAFNFVTCILGLIKWRNKTCSAVICRAVKELIEREK